MAKFRIELKQHTPLIHFQSEQPGAILRATEVKPKLDRFLIECAFNNEFNEYKQYLIGYKAGKKEYDFKDKKAFDYKLRITTDTKNIQEENIEFFKYNKSPTFPNYFGNMGKDKKNKDKKNKFVFCDVLNLEIFSLNKNLLVKIGEKLPLFLMKHNFGQRQSKGFGSFFINNENKYFINDDEQIYSPNEINNVKKLRYSFDVDFNTNFIKKNINNQHIINKKDFYKEAFGVFNQIQSIYTRIRRGGQKFDPYIKKYVVEQNIIWDKDAIKEKYCDLRINNNNKRYLVKDLLGLSSTEVWVKSNKIITKEHETIQRYQSPIFFKPLKVSKDKYIVYFEGREISKEYLSKEFLVRCNGTGELKLNTPENFSINEFLDYVEENDRYIRINE
ncbi:TPA: hypothetical protein ACX96Z_003962 [Clostridium sporogenes]